MGNQGLRWGVLALLALAAGIAFSGRKNDAVTRWVHDRNLVWINGGSFRMGSLEDGTWRTNRVTVPGFWMGRYEVTREEYAEYLRETTALVGGWNRRRDRYKPVSQVSYADAANYARWLGGKYGVVVRLPTEEEWEYAARGGVPDARYPWGWGEPDSTMACWNETQARPVGSYTPNRFGLYDMAGNVLEWCAAEEDGAEGVAPVRGGSWAEKSDRSLRVHHRMRLPVSYRDADVGFRILVELPRPATE